MDWFVRRFVKASLVWFALGMSLGVFMTVRPALIAYRPAHVHMTPGEGTRFQFTLPAA